MLQYENLTRQADLIPISILDTPVTVIGAGAIGSFVVLQLAKMGFHNITVYDFDKIEIENMNSQFYQFSDIGKQKVKALTELVYNFTEIRIKGVNERYGEKSECSPGIVISAVDSMKVRKVIWESVSGLNDIWLLDPRMGALDCALYVVKTSDLAECREYDKTLRKDEDSVSERCTAKATIFTANLLSGLVSKSVVDCLSGVPIKSALWSIQHNDLQVFNRGNHDSN